MIGWLQGLHPLLQTFLATLFTWGMTALGAAVVLLTKGVERKLLDGMLGFAGGVMIAASFWSLLGPAVAMCHDRSYPAWLPAAIGFTFGGLLLRVIDRILPHLHVGFTSGSEEGLHTRWRRSTLLVLAITLHNFPEGLAVGVAFGAAAAGFPEASLAAAVALTIGIGIQNFPEGLAVSMPLKREGMSSWKALWFGQLSGIVEPIAGLLGVAAVITSRGFMPYALGFAAGAMIFVVVEEVIPESQLNGNTDVATLGAMAGFIVMMILDVTFAPMPM